MELGRQALVPFAEDLDFTAQPATAALEAPAAPAPAPPAAGSAAPKPAKAPKRDTIPLPARMVEGAWVELLGADDEPQAAKLHYVSPMKSHFLFVDRQGRKVFECSRSMLSRRVKLGEVTLLDGEPDASLFDRIMDGIFGKLKAAAPA